jgi:regulator of sigma E protease
MIDILHTALVFIVAISVLVAVHEYGHFWMARRCGVRVLKFSIGFGQTLFSRFDKHGTEYIVAAIPFGGYVKMVDEREEAVPEQWLPEAFNRKTVWQRMAIVIAGPAANFLLALVAYWGLNLGGQEGLIPIIGKVEKNSVAEVAGLETGQEIIAIDGQPTRTRYDVSMALVNRLGDSGEIKVSLKYPDADYVYESVLDIHDWLKEKDSPEPVSGIGIDFYYPEVLPVVGQLVAGAAAEKAGIQVGDQVLSVDDFATKHWEDMVDYVRARPGQLLRFVVKRGDTIQTFLITPEMGKSEKGENVGLIGIAVKPPEWPKEMIRHYHYGVFAAGAKSVRDVTHMSVLFLVSIKKLVTGHISTKNISGPLTMATMADESARAGLKSFIALVAVLSISLGVMNLLPIPVLDGGHLFYYLVEALTGKPIPLRVQEYGFQVGLFLIIALMTLAFYNDLMRL